MLQATIGKGCRSPVSKWSDWRAVPREGEGCGLWRRPSCWSAQQTTKEIRRSQVQAIWGSSDGHLQSCIWSRSIQPQSRQPVVEEMECAVPLYDFFFPVEKRARWELLCSNGPEASLGRDAVHKNVQEWTLFSLTSASGRCPSYLHTITIIKILD